MALLKKSVAKKQEKPAQQAKPARKTAKRRRAA
jgi:hypothetical protein